MTTRLEKAKSLVDYGDIDDKAIVESIRKQYKPDSDPREFAQYMGYSDPMEFEGTGDYIGEDKRNIFNKMMDSFSFKRETFISETAQRIAPQMMPELKKKYDIDSKSLASVFKDTSVWQVLPVVRGVYNTFENATVYAVAERYSNGKAQDGDEEFLKSYAKYKNMDSTIPFEIAKGVMVLPSFMAEFVGTFGASKAIGAGVVKSLGGGAIKGFGQTALQAIPSTIAQTAMMPTLISENLSRRLLPDVSIDDAQNLYFTENDDFNTAMVKALGESWVEVASERTGFLFGKVLAPLNKIGQNALMKLGIANAFARLNGVGLNKATEMAKQFGFHGIIEEFAEERAGDVMRAGLGIEEFKLPTLKQVATELAIFTVPATGVGMANVALSKTGNKADIDPETISISEEENKNIEALKRAGLDNKQIEDLYKNVDDAKRAEVIEQVESKETEETLYAYEEKKLEWIQQAMDRGESMEKAEAKIEGFSKGLEGLSKILGINKIDMAKLMIKEGKEQEATNLLIEEARKYASAEEFVKEQTKEIRVQYFKKIQKEQEKLFNEFDMSGTPQEKLKKINLRDKATEKLTKKIYSELEEKIKQQTQQLTDIYNKAQELKQEATDPLIAEARKYASAEEFVKEKIPKYELNVEDAESGMVGFGKGLRDASYSGKLFHKGDRRLIDLLYNFSQEELPSLSTQSSEILFNQFGSEMVIVFDVKNKKGKSYHSDADAGKYYGYDEFRTVMKPKEYANTKKEVILSDEFYDLIQELDTQKTNKELGIENDDVRNWLFQLSHEMQNDDNIEIIKASDSNYSPDFLNFDDKSGNRQIKTKQQLTDIWNKANKNNADDALINEAKKYKSAEEFVNRIGSRSYYPKESYMINKQARQVSNKTYAENKGINKEEIVTIYRAIPSKAKGISDGDFVTTDKELARFFSREKWVQDEGGSKIVTKKVKAGEIYYPEADSGGYVSNELVYVPDKNKLLNRQQLTEIWNKSQELKQEGRKGFTEAMLQNELAGDLDTIIEAFNLPENTKLAKFDEALEKMNEGYEARRIEFDIMNDEYEGDIADLLSEPLTVEQMRDMEDYVVYHQELKQEGDVTEIKYQEVKDGLLQSDNFNEDELYDKLGIMYGNELRLSSLEAQVAKDSFKKSKVAKKELLDKKLGELADEIIEDISPRIKDWLDYHGAESPSTWADMVLDENGEMGETLINSDGVVMVGGINGQQEISIADAVVDKYNEGATEDLETREEQEQYIEDLTGKTQEELTELTDEEVYDEYKEAQYEDYDYIREIESFSELIDMYGSVKDFPYDIKQTVREVLETQAYDEWYEGGGIDADVIDGIQTAYDNLQSADTTREKIMAIDKAINLQHHTGAIADFLDLSKDEMDELSSIGDRATVEGKPLKTLDFNEDLLLYQRAKKNKVTKGSYKVIDGTAILSLFEAKDDTTLMHEFAHHFFNIINTYKPEMLEPVLKEAKVKNLDGDNYIKAQEYFARSYEAYLRKGEAPTPELKSLFQKLSEWIREVYKNLSDMEVQLTPTMQKFFDDIYSGEITKPMTGIELFQKELIKLRENKDQLLQRLGIGKVSRQDIEAEVSQKQEEQAFHPKVLLKDYDKIYVPERLRDDMKNIIDAYRTKFTMKLEDNATNLDNLLPELAEISGLSEDRIIDAMDDAVTKGLKSKAELRGKAKDDLAEQYGLRKEPMTLRQMQTEITNYIKNLELEAKDKAKFLDTIKNATSETKLKNLIEKVSARAKLLKEAQLKREIAKELTKELKTTKATSKGERYNYEANELFVKLRAFNKLSKENARTTKESLVNEVESEKDLPDNYERIQISFLEYKEMGLDSDYRLMEQVLADIQEMKRLGAEAKNEADFKAKVNRLEQRVELANAIVNNKLNKNVVLKTLASHYAINMGNIFNIVNAIANKEVANKMNLEMSESDRMIGIFQSKQQMIKDASKAMGMTERELYNRLEKMAKEEYAIKRTDDVEVKFDKTQLLHLYLMIQNENTRNLVNRYYNFGEFETMEYNLDGETYSLSQSVGELLGNLSEKELQMADAVKYIVQSYYDSNNEVHIRRTGRALKTEENYFPRTSEYETDNPEIVPVGSEFASFQKDRKSGALPSPSNFWHVAERHIEQSEHIKTVSDRYIELKKIINSNQVLETEAGNKTLPMLLKDTYGINVIKALNKALDRASIMALGNETNFALGMEDFFLNNWIKSKISLNPNVFLKQLTSTTNYAEDIPSIEWAKYFMEGMANPKATFDYMWNNSPYLQARYKSGYNEQLSRIMKEANAVTKLQDLTNALTFLTKAGDIGAIIYGGYPAIKYHLAQGRTMQEAEALFRQATIRSQQSGLGSSIDMKQADKNAFLRMFMAFKNTPRQYFRKIADVNIQLINGNINADQYVKTMLHYGVIQPALFGFIGGVIPYALGGGDDKDFWEYSFANVFRNIMLSPFLSMVLVGDIAQVAYRRLTNDRIYNVFSISMLDDVEKAVKRLTKKSVTVGDFFTELLTTGVDIVAGLPATQTVGYGEKIQALLEDMK